MDKLNDFYYAGSEKKGDIKIYIKINKNGGISIDINSKFNKLYKEDIYRNIESVLFEYGIKHAEIIACDNGALNFAIKSRLASAINRCLYRGECNGKYV